MNSHSAGMRVNLTRNLPAQTTLLRPIRRRLVAGSFSTRSRGTGQPLGAIAYRSHQRWGLCFLPAKELPT
jgi:hypothetical protein